MGLNSGGLNYGAPRYNSHLNAYNSFVSVFKFRIVMVGNIEINKKK